MRVVLCSLAVCVLPSVLAAQGMAQKDPEKIEEPARAALGAGYVKTESSETRIRFMCETCKGTPVVDVIMGRQTDGTEQRFRSGKTTIAGMEKICQARDPGCRLVRSDVGPAVGWRTSYTMGPMQGATLVLFRDGDMLTVRSISEDRAATEHNLDVMFRSIAPIVVGG